MAELVGARVVAPEALLQVLKALADKLENLEISLPQRDQYAFLILATLPWVGIRLLFCFPLLVLESEIAIDYFTKIHPPFSGCSIPRTGSC